MNDIRGFLDARETKPLSNCPRCRAQLSKYEGVDEEGRRYSGRICRSCPRDSGKYRWLIFVGVKTSNDQGSYKRSEDQGDRIFEISFDASGNQAGAEGYHVWDGKLQYTPPFNLVKKEGKTVRP